jgi:hypothetical protein
MHPHTAALTARTLEEMEWEVLPYPIYKPDLALSDFHLFSPLRGPRRKESEPTMELKFCAMI